VADKVPGCHWHAPDLYNTRYTTPGGTLPMVGSGPAPLNRRGLEPEGGAISGVEASVRPRDNFQRMTSPALLATRGIVRAVLAGPIRPLRSPREPGGEQTAWRSAILKVPVPSATVLALGLAGDAQKEKKHHGGPLKAVLVYGASHYPAHWDAVLPAHAAANDVALRNMSSDVDASQYGFGAFGENLTIDGLTESTVCLGDIWRIGSCELRITEPRGPCATLTRRWMRPALLPEFHATAAAGWYNAVHRVGAVTTGDVAELVERVQDEWTVARVYHLEQDRVIARADAIALRDALVATDNTRQRMARRLTTPSRLRD
jgi:MOSC domain-containing protein YiiM